VVPAGTAAIGAAIVLISWRVVAIMIEKPCNGRVLPFAATELSTLLDRSVKPGRLKLTSPLTAELRQISLGPSSSERSAADAHAVKVILRPLLSLLERRFVISLDIRKLNVTLRQSSNRSWLGFPDDTHPVSSRPFLALPASSQHRKQARNRQKLRLTHVSFSDATLNLCIYDDPETRVLRPLRGCISLPKAEHPSNSGVGSTASSTSSSAQTSASDSGLRFWLSATARHRGRRHMRWTFNHPKAARTLRQHELEGEARAREQLDTKTPQTDDAGVLHVTGSPEQVSVTATSLEAQLLERLLDVPLDIRTGVLDGSVTATFSHDRDITSVAGTRFRHHGSSRSSSNGAGIPHLDGLFKLHDASIHVFDAPDLLHMASGFLSLNNNQVSLLHTRAMYGALPLAASGAIDLSTRPADGKLSISARTRRPVPLRDLRETLGVRPTPRPLEGDAEGEILVGGSPLKPLITGYARAVRPQSSNERILQRSHEALGWAAEAMLREPAAVAAYDRVPLSMIRTAFSVDPQEGIFRLHEAHALPTAVSSDATPERSGVSVRGRLKTKPEESLSPDCIDLDFSGDGILASTLSAPYESALTGGKVLPSSARELVLGDDEQSATLSVRGTMRGPQLAPAVRLELGNALSGSLKLSRQGIEADVAGSGGTSASCSLTTAFPPPERAAGAVTEREALEASTPSLEHLRASIDVPSALLNRVVPIKALPPLRLRGGCMIDGKPTASGFEGNVTLSENGVSLNSLHLAPANASGVVRNGEVAVQSQDGGVWLRRASLVGNSGLRLKCNDLSATAELLAGGGVKADIGNLDLDKLEIGSLRGSLSQASAHATASGGAADFAIAGPRAAGLAGDTLRGEASFKTSTGDAMLHSLEVTCGESSYSLSGEVRDRAPYRAKLQLQSARLEHVTAAYALATELAELVLEGGRRARDTARKRFDAKARSMVKSVSGTTLLEQISGFSHPASPKESSTGAGPASSSALLSASGRGSSLSSSTEMAPSQWLAKLQSSLSSSKSTSAEYAGSRSSSSSSDYATAAATVAASVATAARKVEARPEEQRQQQHRRLPPRAPSLPTSVSGEIDGSIDATFLSPSGSSRRQSGAASSAPSPVPDEATFDVSASSVSVPQLEQRLGSVGGIVKGKFAESYVRFDRLGVHQDASNGEASLELSGTVGGSNQDASFHAVDIPAGALASSVSGSLYAQGRVHGSMSDPRGFTRIRLVDGAVGGARLAHAEATASLSGDNRASVSAVAAPASADGHVHCEGDVPLPPLAGDERVCAKLRARGSGVPAVVQALGPSGLVWEGGSADADGIIDGTIDSPNADARVSMHRAQLSWPAVLGTAQRATVSTHARLKDGVVHVDSLDARVGRRGTIKARGALPLTSTSASTSSVSISSSSSKANDQHNRPRWRRRSGSPSAPYEGTFSSSSSPSSSASTSQWEDLVAKAESSEGIRIDASALDIRARGSLSARVDANLRIAGSVRLPDASGSVSVSRGTLVVSGNGGAGGSNSNKSTAKSSSASPPLNIRLSDLKVKMGPNLRVVVPLVLNLAVDGTVSVTGGAPSDIKPSGVLSLPYGDLNLLATGAHLDRDYGSTATFDPEGGLVNPALDLCLVADGTVALVRGRASNWRESVTVVGGGPMLRPGAVQPDGRLAVAALASRTLEHLLPKLETRGRLGIARWRVSGSPSVHALSLGTTLEVRVGDKLLATAERRSGLDASKTSTAWSLMYSFSPRLSFTVDSSPPYPRKALFKFTSSPETDWRVHHGATTSGLSPPSQQQQRSDGNAKGTESSAG
jgi:hypothetical protein